MEHGRESDQESRASNKNCSKNSGNESRKMTEKEESKSETESSSAEEESGEEVQSQETGMAIRSNYHIVGGGGVSDEEEDAFIDEEQSWEEEEKSAEEEQFDTEEDALTDETEPFAPQEEENEEEGESQGTGGATDSSYPIVSEEVLSGEDKNDLADEDQSDLEEDAFADESKKKENKRSKSETESFASEEESDESFQPLKTNSKNMQEVVLAGPNPPPPLPHDFKNWIQTLSKGQEISISDEILVIQKQLSEIEASQRGERFKIPLGIIWNELFNDDEIKTLTLESSIRVTMIDPVVKNVSVQLKRYLMMSNENRKAGGEPRRAYFLQGDWNRFAASKNLEEGDIVQLWAVRVGGNLCFLIVNLSRGAGDSSGDNSSIAVGTDTHEGEAQANTSSPSTFEE